MPSPRSVRDRPAGRAAAVGAPAWVKVLGVLAAVFIAVVVVLHLSGHAMGGHGLGDHGMGAPEAPPGTERSP